MTRQPDDRTEVAHAVETDIHLAAIEIIVIKIKTVTGDAVIATTDTDLVKVLAVQMNGTAIEIVGAPMTATVTESVAIKMIVTVFATATANETGTTIARGAIEIMSVTGVDASLTMLTSLLLAPTSVLSSDLVVKTSLFEMEPPWTPIL